MPYKLLSPRPWSAMVPADARKRILIVARGGVPIAHVFDKGVGRAQARANARAICAVPHLLECAASLVSKAELIRGLLPRAAQDPAAVQAALDLIEGLDIHAKLVLQAVGGG